MRVCAPSCPLIQAKLTCHVLVTLLHHVMTFRCINADPNYGGMWFHCKDHPCVLRVSAVAGRFGVPPNTFRGCLAACRSDTAVQIIRRAKILLCLDLAAAFLDEDHIPMTFGTSATVTSFCPDVQGVVLSPSLRGRLLFGSDQIIA